MPFITWLFENRVMRIVFELGEEGCIMWSFIICTACQVVGYQKTVTKWFRNVACMGMQVIVNRILIGKRKERVHSEGLYECRRIMLQWILRNSMRMDFDYALGEP